MRRVARLLEAVGLGRDDRVDEAELVDEEDPAAGSRDAGELGDDELRAAGVVENAHAARDVERAVLERQCGRVADDELAVRPARARCPLRRGRPRGRRRRRCSTKGASANASAPAPQPLSSARSVPSNGARSCWTRSLSAAARRSWLASAISDHVTHRRSHAPLGWPARRSRRRSHRGSCLKPARGPRSAPRRRSA